MVERKGTSFEGVIGFSRKGRGIEITESLNLLHLDFPQEYQHFFRSHGRLYEHHASGFIAQTYPEELFLSPDLIDYGLGDQWKPYGVKIPDVIGFDK